MEKMKPGSRKPHRKTRTGCKTCKQRKIKCDEQRPQCTNCVKHSVPCDYLSPAVGSTTSPGLSQPPTPSATTPGELPSHGPSPLSNQLPSAHPPDLNMIDLELLHNFCTSTCLTLYEDARLKDMWKITVPQLGFQYDFVMRGILAISALHIARFVPDKSDYYMSQAMMHYQSGLQTASALLSKIDETNCEAIWIFSNFPLFWTLATAHQTDDFLLIGNSIGASWLDLVRGASAILSQTHEQLHAGSLGPTFRLGAIRADLREQAAYDFPPDQDPTQDLRSQMAYSKLPPESYDLCMKAIEELRKSFALFYNNANRTSNDFGDIFIWLFRVNNGYLDLIRDHCQEAIAIFAYFCVMLKALDHKWWIQGAAVHLLKQIWDALDEDHRLWIRWPIEQIGWIPSSTASRMTSAVNTPAAAPTTSTTPAHMSPPAPAT